MKDVKVSKNFYLWEFVPPDVYEKYGEYSLWFVDHGTIMLAQYLRDFIGKPVILNTWKTGPYLGQIFTHSGFRPPYSSVGAPLSQHRFGRAIDAKIVGMRNAEEVRVIIRDNWPEFRALGLGAIEKDTATWIHMDRRLTNSEVLLEFKYYKTVGGDRE